MARPSLRDSTPTIHWALRIDTVLAGRIEAEAERRGITKSVLIRTVLEQWLAQHDATKAKPQAVKHRKVRGRDQPEATRPDANDDPVAFLASLRQPAPSRHRMTPGVDGPVCARCGARPSEDSSCLP